jgi:cytoskeletal protein RodZ
MKLIRRKKEATPFEKGLAYVKLGVRGLVALRVTRNAFKGYRHARRLPFILGIGFVAFLVKKLVGRKDTSEAQWTPPSTAQTPASPSTPPPAAAGASNGATKPATPAVETAATGSSPADVDPEPPTAPATEVSAADAEVVETGASTSTGTTDADGPELKPEGGDVAPELDTDEK